MSASPASSPSPSPLKTGAVIGVLGGGQLGRMIALAAAELGFETHVLAPEPDSPAAQVCAHATIADYENLDAVAAFARACDVVTYEFENIPVVTARAAGAQAPLRPGVKALEVAQDRAREKAFAAGLGAQTVTYAEVDDPRDLAEAIATVGAPAVLKTRRQGYDGKGQTRITRGDVGREGWAEAAFAAAGGAPAILEAMADFTREISVVAARGLDGSHAVYAPSENRHEGGVLHEARAPIALDADVEAHARAIAAAALDALDHVGVLAIEFFELAGGRLLFNELAPRVHNSGHWTMDACACGQFEMHVRAIAGWPLGDPALDGEVVMTNLFGEDVLAAPTIAAEPGARVHVYGKKELAPGRKTGHVNRVTR